MNVPTSITLENLNSTPTATFRTKLFGAENGQVKEAINKYELSINTIPTKEIRIFSAADNSIRTVKVNTELILELIFLQTMNKIDRALYTYSTIKWFDIFNHS